MSLFPFQPPIFPFQPPIEHKQNGIYTDSTRQMVLTKMFAIVEGTEGLAYRFTPEDYLFICTDHTGKWICSERRARDWFNRAKRGQWKAGVRGDLPRQRRRLTDAVKDVLYDIVVTHPCATKYQYQNYLYAATGLQFSPDYLNREINKMGLPLKKISYEKKAKFTEENLAYYREFVALYKETEPHRIVFCDQTGFDRYSFHAKRARSPIGTRAFSADQSPKGKRINCTGLMARDPSRDPFYFCLTHETNTFESWAEFVKCAHTDGYIKAGDVIIVDNWSGFVGRNTGEILAEVLGTVGISIWPLPTYSPELNAIELLWHWAKSRLRKLQVPINDEGAMQQIFEELSAITNVQGFVSHVENYISSF